MSARMSAFWASLICSGATKSGVPSIQPVPVRLASPSTAWLEPRTSSPECLARVGLGQAEVEHLDEPPDPPRW